MSHCTEPEFSRPKQTKFLSIPTITELRKCMWVRIGKGSNLRMVEYTSQRIPPVQYIKTSIFSLSTFTKGSESVTWIRKHKVPHNYIQSTHHQKNKHIQTLRVQVILKKPESKINIDNSIHKTFLPASDISKQYCNHRKSLDSVCGNLRS